MNNVSNSQAANSSNGSNSNEGTSSTGMKMRETQSAFNREPHDARPRESRRMNISQKTVEAIGYDSNQSCDPLEPTLKNALVPYTGKQLDASASTTALILNDSEAKRRDLLANSYSAIRSEEWDTLDTLINSLSSIDLTDDDLQDMCENIYRQALLAGNYILYENSDLLKSEVNSLFIFSITNDQIALMKLLLKIGYGDYLTIPMTDQLHPMKYASLANKVEMVKLLLPPLAHKFHAEKKHEYLYRLLCAAVFIEDIECVKLLIDYGADPKLSNVVQYQIGESPLMIAINRNRPDLLTFLLKSCQDDPNGDKDKPSPLLKAIYLKNIQCIEVLLLWGADCNGFGNFRSPLSAAVQNGSVHIATCLRIKGATLAPEDTDAYNKLLSDNNYDNNECPLALESLGLWKINPYLHSCTSIDEKIELAKSLEIPHHFHGPLLAGLHNGNPTRNTGNRYDKAFYQRHYNGIIDGAPESK